MAVMLHLLMPRGRVGSNLLTAILNRSKFIKMNNEVLTSIRSKYGVSKNDILKCEAEQISFLEKFNEDAKSEKSENLIYVGLKTDLTSVININSFLFDGISKDSKIIYLYRRNFIKQAISLIRAERNAERMHEKYGARLWGIKTSADILPREHIEPAAIFKLAEKMEMAHHLSLNSIALLNIDKLIMTYEDINHDLSAATKTVENFLQTPLIAEAKFVKATPDKIRDAVANYDELCHFFSNTRFAECIIADYKQVTD